MADEEKKRKQAADILFYNKEKSPPRYGWRYGRMTSGNTADVLFYNDNDKAQQILPIHAE